MAAGWIVRATNIFRNCSSLARTDAMSHAATSPGLSAHGMRQLHDKSNAMASCVPEEILKLDSGHLHILKTRIWHFQTHFEKGEIPLNTSKYPTQGTGPGPARPGPLGGVFRGI